MSEVGEAGQSIVTGTGERLNVKWAAGVEEVSRDDENMEVADYNPLFLPCLCALHTKL